MSLTDLFIPVILGTAREGRRSENAARFVYTQLAATGVRTELVDVRESQLSATHVDWMDQVADVVGPWVKKATAADGFIIVSPEYNHFFPGELKMFLDQTLKPYQRKPAGLVGVSNGNWGGTRVVENLRTYTSRLGMVAVYPAAYFPKINELFDDTGACTNPEQATLVQPMIDEVLWYARALKTARQL